MMELSTLRLRGNRVQTTGFAIVPFSTILEIAKAIYNVKEKQKDKWPKQESLGEISDFPKWEDNKIVVENGKAFAKIGCETFPVEEFERVSKEIMSMEAIVS